MKAVKLHYQIKTTSTSAHFLLKSATFQTSAVTLLLKSDSQLPSCAMKDAVYVKSEHVILIRNTCLSNPQRSDDYGTSHKQITPRDIFKRFHRRRALKPAISGGPPLLRNGGRWCFQTQLTDLRRYG